MARPSDRMRLKDKIVDEVSKAIKAIQEHLYHVSKDPLFPSNPNSKGTLILGNGDRLCHKLCDKLDHAFLHGLREVTHGYWKLFKMLSHKGMIREIDVLTNVTTDLGRGRAWMYASLNEGLLESYFRLLGENEKLLKKHYNKEALLLDKDRMNVLLTLTSGLDFVTFQLDYDLPYLDLSPSPPRTQSSFQDGDFAKVRGKQLPADVGPTTQQSDSDSASVSSVDVPPAWDMNARVSCSSGLIGEPVLSDSMVTNNGDAKDSTGTFSSNFGFGFKSDRSLTPTDAIYNHISKVTPDSQSLSSTGSASELDRHQRFESIVSVNEVLVEEEAEDSLEVIRIKSKKKKKKSKSSIQHPTASNKDSSNITNATDSTNKRAEEGNHQIPSSVSTSRGSEMTNLEIVSDEQVQKKNNAASHRGAIPQLDSGIDICDIVSDNTAVISDNNECDIISDYDAKTNSKKENSDEFHQNLSEKELEQFDCKSAAEKSSQALIESKIAEMCGDIRIEDKSDILFAPYLDNPVKQDMKTNIKIDSSESSCSNTHPPKNVKDSESNNLAMDTNVYEQNHIGILDEGDTFYSAGRDAGSPSLYAVDKTLPEGDQDDYYDVYSKNSLSPMGDQSKRNDNHHRLTKLQQASHLQDYMDCVLKDSESSTEDSLAASQDSVPEDFSLSLDNNTKLQVMLEILKQEDESFIKIFACRENHTEGQFSVAFVLISDVYLYLLHYKPKIRKFIIQSVTKLTDIIFISTGLFDQTLNIESRDRNRQKQRLWLTPGHQDLTKAIVQCLTDVVKRANASIVSVRTRFSVGSDVPLQKIGLRKYISKELDCETQDVVINDYSLVFWEDPSSSKSSYSESKTKEGTLLLRTQDATKGFIWKPVYVVLQSSMLSISNSKSDHRPHSYLGLGGDQCVGCRLTEVGERLHCVELVLAQGGRWHLSAATDNEILDWRRSLCLAVSRGVEEMGALSACVPCCCVQASNQLFMCHEDLDTKFFRTLGRANLEDITGVSGDREEAYCVVEFESQEVGVTSGKWVFHFASSADKNRFTTSLTAGWKEIFQVDLPISALEDVTLQRHCQSHSVLLRKSFELR